MSFQCNKQIMLSNNSTRGALRKWVNEKKKEIVLALKSKPQNFDLKGFEGRAEQISRFICKKDKITFIAIKHKISDKNFDKAKKAFMFEMMFAYMRRNCFYSTKEKIPLKELYKEFDVA